jgi:hypothetical protein
MTEKEQILNFELSDDERIQLLNEYYKKDKDGIIEILHKIISMYTVSGITILRKFLVNISIKSEIPFELKCLTCNALFSFTEYKEHIELNDEEKLVIAKKDSNKKIDKRNKVRLEIAYDILNNICIIEKNENKLPIPRKIELIFRLMEHPKYKQDCIVYFINFLENKNIESVYKYKTILSIEYNTKLRTIHKNYFLEKLMMEFIKLDINLIYYKILACQYLLKKKIDKVEIFEYLSKFMTDENLDYNRRSDAADILIRYGNEEFKQLARNVLFFLGSENKQTTIYDNKQNVHVQEIEESVVEILEKLYDTKIIHINGKEITLQDAINQFYNFLKNNNIIQIKDVKSSNEDCEEMKMIKKAFERIELDNITYSKFNMKLSRIFLLIWSYIYNHKYQHELKIRLYEELIDMYNTCSSGFISRLVNVVSGFDNMNIKISFKQQIISNFKGRIQKKIQSITDENSVFRNNKIITRDIIVLNSDDISNKKDVKIQQILDSGVSLDIYMEKFQEKVLNELIINTDKYSERKNFSLFLKVVVQNIYMELYNEFNQYISDDDFELYFREAVYTFEGCHV